MPGWSCGITGNVWPSSEMYEFVNKCHYDYSLALGRLACVNLEVTMLNENSFKRFFSDMYEYGMEFITMFNYKDLDVPAILEELDNIDKNKPRIKEQYYKSICNVNFLKDYNKITLDNINLLKKYNNLTITPEGDLIVVDSGEKAELVFELSHKKKFKNGLKGYIEGFCENGGKIEIFAGLNEINLEKISEFVMGEKLTWFNKHSAFDFPVNIANVNEKIVVKIVLSGENTSLRAIRFDLLWELKQGYLTGNDFNMTEKRIQNLWIQKRAVAKYYIEKYKLESENDILLKANELYEKQYYNEVIELLTKEFAILLPAKFLLKGKGKLEKYPLEFDCDQPVFFELIKSDNEEVIFSIDGNGGENIKIKLLTGFYYTMNKKENTICLTRADSHQNSFNFTVEKEKRHYKENINVIAVDVNDNRIYAECQNPEIGEYANGVDFKLSPNCKFYRKAESETEYKEGKPLRQDLVTIEFDNNGEVIKASSQYGYYEGEVISYEPPNVIDMSNGKITFDNGETYEFYHNHNFTKLKIDEVDTICKNLELDILQNIIKKGMRLKISYTPYTYNGSKKRLLSVEKITN